tara:strand:- start:5195 stop:5878 length:684 start_codon:yes stop_codon:yes gene_type:complete
MDWSTYFNKAILYIDEKSYLKNLHLKQKKNYLEVLRVKEKEFQKEIEELENNTMQPFDININESKNSLVLLIEQKNIITLLNKYCLKLDKINFSFIVNTLKYILGISKILKKRLNQKDVNFSIKDNIQRCSYKFCKFKENCSYNYSKKKNVCYQDHYVHNMVICDLEQIINYITNNLNNENIYLNDFSKSINTISFVINHMYKELNSRCLYITNNKEIEREHVTKGK